MIKNIKSINDKILKFLKNLEDKENFGKNDSEEIKNLLKYLLLRYGLEAFNIFKNKVIKLETELVNEYYSFQKIYKFHYNLKYRGGIKSKTKKGGKLKQNSKTRKLKKKSKTRKLKQNNNKKSRKK